jgi:hypothetical protein
MFGRKRSNNLQLGNILNNENIVFEIFIYIFSMVGAFFEIMEFFGNYYLLPDWPTPQTY